MSTIAAIILGVLAAALAALLYRRDRDLRRVTELGARLKEIAASGALDERLASQASDGNVGEIAEAIDRVMQRMQTDAALRSDRELVYRRLLETTHEAAALARNGVVVIGNARFAELAGADDMPSLSGRRITDLVHPDCKDLVEEHLRRHAAREAAPDRLEVESLAGQRLELSFSRVVYEHAPAVVVTILEVEPRREAAPASASRMPAGALEALDSLGECVLTTDLDGNVMYFTRAVEQMLGREAAEIVGQPLAALIDFIEEPDRKTPIDPVRQAISSGSRITVSRRAHLGPADGERVIELAAAPTHGPGGVVSGSVVMLRDVSEVRGLARTMSYQASHDALTGLVNRREFERRSEEALGDAHAGGHHVLCYLDLDRFKAVNDACGHVAGDNLLREIAGIIKEAVRDSDTVGRLGGDEFGILLTGCPLEKARQIADDVVRAVGDHRFIWKDKIFNVGVSVGLVEMTHESGSLEDLIHAADSACYVAKNHGGHVHVYSAHDEAAARQRGEILWLQLLQSALKDNRFELHAQPIQHAEAGTLGGGPGLEVLLRLKDDKGNSVAPTEFMGAAERYRLMPHVDRWVVQTSLAALARGAVKLQPGRSLCINLSGQTLGDAGFLEFVVECLDRTGVAPERICFEVTENSVITNIEHARRFIGVLHGMGCRFALDDFGRGLSSFANLRNLSLDYLKIDGSFTRNLASDNVNQAMVTAMIKLARSLDFKVVAEQIEDAGTLDSARRMGFDFVQGYQVGRPQPLALAS